MLFAYRDRNCVWWFKDPDGRWRDVDGNEGPTPPDRDENDESPRANARIRVLELF